MYQLTLRVAVDGETLAQAKENAIEYLNGVTEIYEGELVKLPEQVKE